MGPRRIAADDSYRFEPDDAGKIASMGPRRIAADDVDGALYEFNAHTTLQWGRGVSPRMTSRRWVAVDFQHGASMGPRRIAADDLTEVDAAEAVSILLQWGRGVSPRMTRETKEIWKNDKVLQWGRGVSPRMT